MIGKIFNTEILIYESKDKNLPTTNHIDPLLQSQGIPYQEFDLNLSDDQALEMLLRSGQRTVPQVFINERSIGGFTELSDLLLNDELSVQRAIN